jgi:hypothetical protein
MTTDMVMPTVITSSSDYKTPRFTAAGVFS